VPLSSSRIAPFDGAVGGDRAKGLELYLWNIEVASAFQEVLCITEVAVRNAMHDELTGRYGTYWYSSRDLFDDRTQKAFATAWRQLGLPDATPIHSVPPRKFVGELTFGAWTMLLDKGGYAGAGPMRTHCSYDNTLWRTCLHRAFPHHRGPRQDVLLLTRTALALRNRVAHHEPLIWGLPDPVDRTRRPRLSLTSVHQQVLRLVGFVDPDLGGWLSTASRVPGILDVPPTPATGLRL
jgi:hypothetical protein